MTHAPSAGLVLETSSPLVTQLESANGVVLGKTRMHELAEGYTTISAYYGPTLNPYRVDAHVGGKQDTLNLLSGILKYACFLCLLEALSCKGLVFSKSAGTRSTLLAWHTNHSHLSLHRSRMKRNAICGTLPGM